MSKKIIVVNEQDHIIGYKDKDELGPNDIHRAAALWITNSKGEILLAKRSLNKKISPGKWGPAACGTLEEDGYDANILKEAYEELGIWGVSLTPGPKGRSINEDRYFCQFYLAETDLPVESFKPNPNEVAEIRWFTKEEIINGLKNTPEEFSPNMKAWAELLIK